jgi:hypothetical protein
MRHILIAAAAALAFIPSAHAAQWPTVEADNGAVYRILDMVHPSPRHSDAQAQIEDPDGRIMNFVFDCQGHMASFSGGGMRSIAPRSVAGRIAQIACARTHS